VQGGLGPRFLLEAGFLIALAIAAGAAELSAPTIVVVMAVAWLLVCLFELAVWAEGPRFRVRRREQVVVEEPDEITPPDRPREAEAEPLAAAAESRDTGEGRTL
jgi:Sec-independent protein secretion pathway component TatC